MLPETDTISVVSGSNHLVVLGKLRKCYMFNRYVSVFERPDPTSNITIEAAGSVTGNSVQIVQ